MEFYKKGSKFAIGMVHCLPLPGTAFFSDNMEDVMSQAERDAETLERAGIHAVIVENMGDGPFGIRMDTAQIAALSAISAHVARKISIPIGIDAAMNDYESSIAIAKAVGAKFVRIPVFVDTVEFYGGIIEPCARAAMIYRKNLGAENIKILADIHVKHSHMLLPHVTVEDSARVAQECGADGIIVTGTHIGRETPLEIIERVKSVVSIPVIAGSGVTPDNIAGQLAVADGAIVGSSLKDGGRLEEPISFERTVKLMHAIAGGV